MPRRSNEERISTPFGDRDCIVYTQNNGGSSKDVYYMDKNNDVVHKNEYFVNDLVFATFTLRKSSLLVESNTMIGLKNAEDVKKGDSSSFKIAIMHTLVIEGVNLPEGDGTVTYDVRILGVPYEGPLTRDEVIESGYFLLPEYLEDSVKHVGIEIMDTSLGRVNCDVPTRM